MDATGLTGGQVANWLAAKRNYRKAGAIRIVTQSARRMRHAGANKARCLFLERIIISPALLVHHPPKPELILVPAQISANESPRPASLSCQPFQMPHHIIMKSATWSALVCAAFCVLTSCVQPPPKIVKSDIGPGIGPFDSQGNYREDWADDPRKWRRPSAAVASNDRPSANATPLPATQPARPRPSITRHTVKRGDTLSHIARRYGSSVSAIRRANGISGSLIYPGQRLIVPRR